jgi:hypothetical protein
MNTFRNPSLNEMASSGQKRAQTPHPKHKLSSRSASSFSFSFMASVGHRSTHIPQPEQAPWSISERWYVELIKGDTPSRQILRVSQQSLQQLQMLVSGRDTFEPGWKALWTRPASSASFMILNASSFVIL